MHPLIASPNAFLNVLSASTKTGIPLMRPLMHPLIFLLFCILNLRDALREHLRGAAQRHSVGLLGLLVALVQILRGAAVVAATLLVDTARAVRQRCALYRGGWCGLQPHPRHVLLAEAILPFEGERVGEGGR